MTGCSIAIVDDNESDRYILKRHLSELLIDNLLLEFENGAEVLKFMVEDGPAGRVEPRSAFPPKVIILDINMPIMDGYAFLDALEDRLKDDTRCSTVIVLMLSSSDRQDDIDRAMSHALVSDYFVKGVLTGPELVGKIKEYI